jgi:hypothetical protein
MPKHKEPAPESFLPLKPHWFHVLLSLADQDQHGYGIMQEVLERTNGKVRLWPATLYGTLKRLIDEDLIEESDEAGPQGDRRREPAAGGPGAHHSRQGRADQEGG